MAKSFADTPLMRQYASIKAKHPDAMLLFRVGDFYETYMEDAPKAAKILGITLTQRSGTNPELGALAGFPHHALDTYLPKLVRAGLRVAVCDQLEDPKQAKGLVKRGVTELVTPGVALADGVVDTRENNFLACVVFGNGAIGVAFLDITTGEFLMGQGDAQYTDRLLATFHPSEVLFEKGRRQTFVENFGTRWVTYAFDDWAFNASSARDRLLKHFGTQSLRGFGVEDMPCGISAAGAIMHYLDVTEHNGVAHISRIQRLDESEFVRIDKFSIRNLELFNDGRDAHVALADVLDRCTTPMGSRLLKRWLAMPLRDVSAILRRQSAVSAFVDNDELVADVTEVLRMVGDMERLVGKVASRRITPREVLALGRALSAIPLLRKALEAHDVQGGLKDMVNLLDDCAELCQRIFHDMSPEPPTTILKPGVIADGVSEELDEVRRLMSSGRDVLLQLQDRLQAETGIPTLKIGTNGIFGYFIEVRNTHKSLVPESWIRKQTMTNCERYVTQELQDLEAKITSAESRQSALEQALYNALLDVMSAHLGEVQADALRLAEVDVLHTLARDAKDFNYARPDIDESESLSITGGRHPVIERLMPDGETYVANDIQLDREDQQIVVVTGPNMAGKSALLRQTALIVLMAQCGSYVPADAARIGVVDKIFTRVGANDNLSQGESTFMVEMTEAASILNNVTRRSLVLFDELGRGTSTYDGISLAWAIVEHLHQCERASARTLFATHYHELNDMERLYPRIRNYNVSVREVGGKIIFLRKLVRGGSAHSFGIHVARLAGMPSVVVSRAEEVLRDLERARGEAEQEAGVAMSLPIEKADSLPCTTTQSPAYKDVPEEAAAQAAAPAPSSPKKTASSSEHNIQLSFFQLDDPVLSSIRDEIAGLDINNLTPLEALNKLNEIKKLVGV